MIPFVKTHVYIYVYVYDIFQWSRVDMASCAITAMEVCMQLIPYFLL